MACTITIANSNGDKVEVEVPSLPRTLTELKGILSLSGKLGELLAYIRQAVGEGRVIRNSKLSEIKENSNIIPNTTVSTLRERFPQVGFPEIDLDDINVLYINSYITSDSELQFGIFELNGKLVFVIDNNLDHIRKFAAYLSLKSAIENDNFLSKINKKQSDILEECRKASNYSTTEQMVLEYLNNRSLFREYRTNDGKSVFSLLNSVLTNISKDVRTRQFKGEKDSILNEIATTIEENTRKVEYDDSLANDFYLRLKKSGEKTWKIDLQELYKQVLMYDNDIKEVIPDTFEKFKKFLESEEVPEAFAKLFGDSSNKMESIINYIVAKEPWLNMSFSKISSGLVILKNEFPNVQKVYGIGFDTISKMTHLKYNGWYIFSDGTKFYPTEYFMSETTRSLAYNTLEEAKKSIDLNILKLKLNDRDFSQLYTRGEGRRILNKSIPTETLIELKDYDTKYSLITNNIERELLLNGTMEDFYNYVAKYDPNGVIRNNITNALEAVLFIYKKNELQNPDLEEIAKQIHEAPIKYYYVEESYSDSRDNKYHRLLPAKDIKIEEVKENHKIPVIKLFNIIADLFSDKFGIEVEVLSDDEVKEQYGVEDAKAFIIGDKIVLNSTLASSDDIFHEYAHLVLGYLKHKNPLNYRDLIQIIWDNMYIGDKNKILDKYGNLPREAQLEEGFVREFGKYISNNLLNENLLKIFKLSEGFLKDGVSSIFDGEVNINKVFGSTVKSVFNRFNSEIGYLLNSDDDFLSFIKSDEFFLQRKKVNWLEKQIELNKIKEIC